jgi:hypothetical protein
MKTLKSLTYNIIQLKNYLYVQGRIHGEEWGGPKQRKKMGGGGGGNTA